MLIERFDGVKADYARGQTGFSEFFGSLHGDRQQVSRREEHYVPTGSKCDGPADFELWLDPAAPPEAALALLRPYPEGTMAAYPVSRRVNNVANDDPEVIAPLDLDTATEDPAIQDRLL